MEEKMTINRENAMALWNERYGKELKVTDFAGRKMVKGAYGDRNSEFGWNLDHILPQSQGGKDTPSNLVCCHILTNDEKADKFPTFVANGRRFEIIKVQNHYEIKEINDSNQQNVKDDDSIDFFDTAAAMRFLKECKKGYFFGKVKIILGRVKEKSVLDFIAEIFSNYDVTIEKDPYYNYNYVITVFAYDLGLKEDIESLLEDCVMANTYLGYYFIDNDYISGYDIYYSVNHYDYHVEEESVKISFPQNNFGLSNKLVINELVKINTSANKENLAKYNYTEFYEYNFSYIKLRENLKKLRKGNK